MGINMECFYSESNAGGSYLPIVQSGGLPYMTSLLRYAQSNLASKFQTVLIWRNCNWLRSEGRIPHSHGGKLSVSPACVIDGSSEESNINTLFTL